MIPCGWCGSYRGVKAVKVEGRLTQHLCYRCFGVYRESGERPPAYRMRSPAPGPITGRPLDLRRPW
jgi:hypothetical protein